MNLSFLSERVAAGLPPLAPKPGEPVRVGVADAAKAALIAAALRDRDRPALVVVGKASRARELVDELAAWLGDAARRPVC